MNGMDFGNGNGTGESGDGTGSGNPGDGNGNNGSGSGPGGYGGSLGGRGLLKQVDPPNQDNLEGTVKLKITVDENGTVTNVVLISSNCAQCTQLAINAVYQWKYEKKSGSGYQIGTVTIDFRL
jgi:TonB family protein